MHTADHGQPALPPASSEQPQPVAAGTGLFDHAARDPFPRWAGLASAIGAVVVVVAAAAVFYGASPAMRTGTAFGTRDQIGTLGRAGGGGAAEVPEPAAGTPEAEGKLLVGQKGCGGCHVVPGLRTATGTVGPSLAGIGGKRTIAGGAVTIGGPEDMTRWLQNPPGVKPGTQMPNLNLSADEASKITAYLLTLK